MIDLLPASAASGAGPIITSGGGGSGRTSGGTGRRDDGYVDVDTESFAYNDNWALLEHSGHREVKTVRGCCSADATVAGENEVGDGQEDQQRQQQEEQVFVSMMYLLKMRKKLGPSLMGRR